MYLSEYARLAYAAYFRALFGRAPTHNYILYEEAWLAAVKTVLEAHERETGEALDAE